jgi:hypothetical protein
MACSQYKIVLGKAWCCELWLCPIFLLRTCIQQKQRILSFPPIYFYTYSRFPCSCFLLFPSFRTDAIPSILHLLPVFSIVSIFFYYYYLVCEAIGTAATPGLLCQPRVIVKMIVEKQMEWRLAGETEMLGENLPQRHFCPSQNPTWPDPGLNPGRRSGKPATNLRYGAALPLYQIFLLTSSLPAIPFFFIITLSFLVFNVFSLSLTQSYRRLHIL